ERSSPRWESSAPRKKFPPPTTMAICTPARFASAVSRATADTTSGARPSAPPPNTSPECLSSPRRRAAAVDVSDGTFMQTSEVMVRGWPRPGYGPGPPDSWSGAAAEPDEAGHRAARALDDLADRGLRVTGVGLLEEDVLLVEAVHPALDD